ncbi:LuxR C-terminal-related transcriptional regulator [Paracoccus sp. IB05]|uniref:LuxR C-terminal-related transcriptional regulator n=1 Tax=Paracoccus sp. IB05 TaxID=2779367 RepID=UPI0018E7A2D0|nr:LuxR C-terminal-related transcriptional regulator [Paracoccus sp. IB05]MBJ2149377.1 PAS domain-containing protein [Paracoccus sp. IB05]
MPSSAPDDLAALAFLHAPEATLVLRERVIRRANLAAGRVFGWDPGALEGCSMRVLYPGETDFERLGQRAEEALRLKPMIRDERFMRRQDGQLVWMEGRGVTLTPKAPHRLAIWTYRVIETGAAPGLLTPAEMRVARHMVGGMTSKEIARVLDCSPRTVEVHRASMIRKLRVRNSFELIRSLLDSGAAPVEAGSEGGPES